MAAEAGIGRLLTGGERTVWPDGVLRSAFVVAASYALTAWHCVRDIGGADARLWLRLPPRDGWEPFVDVPVRSAGHDPELDAALLAVDGGDALREFLESVALPLVREVRAHDRVRVGGSPQRNSALHAVLFGGTVESADALIGRHPAVRVHVPAFAARYAEVPDGMSGGPLLLQLPDLTESAAGVVVSYPRAGQDQGATGGAVICRRIAELCDRFPELDAIADPVAPPSLRPRPRRVGIVPRLADCFQPRALADAATGGYTTVLTGRPTRMLSGLGGVGKTQLAVQHAERLWRDGQLDLLVWIAATNRHAIQAAYAQAAVDLALQGADGTNTEQDAARFHAWLSSTDQRWLIVLDDLVGSGDLQRLWPPSRPTGRTVVTTRLRGSALRGVHLRVVEVGTFTPREAVQYVRARLADDPELADDVDGLAGDLGYLPLALAQATAFMIDERMPISQYRQRFADRRCTLDDLVPDPQSPNGLPDDYDRTVAATLSLSVEAADRSRPAGIARPLLELASVLDPSGIPASVLTGTAAAVTFLADRRAGGVNAALVTSGLQCLHRLNLMTVDADLVTVHALVQRATRETLADRQLAEVVRSAADALAQAWPAIERDTAYTQRLRDNTAAAYQHGRDALLRPEAHAVLFTAANSLGISGNAAGAVRAFEQLSADLADALGPEHGQTLTARLGCARWRGEAGDTTGAVSELGDLLTDVLSVLGPDDPIVLKVRYNMARWTGISGDAAAALAAFEPLLADQSRVLGPDDPDTFSTRGAVIYWRGMLGDAAAAVIAFEQLLEDRLRVLGPDHRDTLTSRYNVARWRGHAGDAPAAAAAFEQLLADRLRLLGPDHPDTLGARHSLAYWRGEAGDVPGALAAFEQLLADRVRLLGPDHPRTLGTRANVARWRGEAGDPAGAAADYEQLLIDRLRVLGPDHPATLRTRGGVARWRGEAGEPLAAAAAFEQLLDDCLRLLGPDHRQTSTTRRALAYWQARASEATG